MKSNTTLCFRIGVSTYAPSFLTIHSNFRFTRYLFYLHTSRRDSFYLSAPSLTFTLASSGCPKSTTNSEQQVPATKLLIRLPITFTFLPIIWRIGFAQCIETFLNGTFITAGGYSILPRMQVAALSLTKMPDATNCIILRTKMPNELRLAIFFSKK